MFNLEYICDSINTVGFLCSSMQWFSTKRICHFCRHQIFRPSYVYLRRWDGSSCVVMENYVHLNFEKYATKAFSYECFLLLFTSFPSLRILKKKNCTSDPSFCDAFMHECNQFDCNKRQIRYEISPIIPKLLLSTITHHPSSQNAHPKKASQEFRTDDHFAASPIQNDSINLSNALSAKLSTSFFCVLLQTIDIAILLSWLMAFNFTMPTLNWVNFAVMTVIMNNCDAQMQNAFIYGTWNNNKILIMPIGKARWL